MENEYLIESLRQLRHTLGEQQVIFVHLVYLPFLEASQELKTRPAQSSVKDLRARGIEPDLLIVRSERPIEKAMLQKLSLMTGVEENCVISSPTVKSIYQVPLNYQSFALGNILLGKLNLPQRPFNLSRRSDLLTHIEQSKTSKKIAIVGKYTALEDAYYSLNEALKVAGYRKDIKVQLSFIDTEKIEKNADKLEELFASYAGMVIPSGAGGAGKEGFLLAIRYARTHQLPCLAVGLGAQMMTIEFAKNVLGYHDAASEEDTNETKHPVVYAPPHQPQLHFKEGTLRVGAYDCILDPNSLAFRLYKKEKITERHHHHYEINPAYRTVFAEQGLQVSGTSPDGSLIEMIEIKGHPFMIGTLAHPEFTARPLSPHPLFLGFIEALL